MKISFSLSFLSALLFIVLYYNGYEYEEIPLQVTLFSVTIVIPSIQSIIIYLQQGKNKKTLGYFDLQATITETRETETREILSITSPTKHFEEARIGSYSKSRHFMSSSILIPIFALVPWVILMIIWADSPKMDSISLIW
ncbi:MAG: hypothetical protein B6244_12930 [Candidatus Cloacimonetes bacterium 4572_55]|nr:MAG: hypothetical protein B6244_12930 [Candidatus Cloacimonetes bacterium 4572_55]